MQRYFCQDKHDQIFTLSKDDSYHIFTVMRMNLFDTIEIVYENDLYLAEIMELEPNVKAKILEKKEEQRELSYQVTIVQSLVKEQKMDYILQKSTELGVSEFIPFTANRSIVKLDQKQDKKIERWQKVVKEASEQSKRTSIPIVTNVINLSNLVKLSDYDMKFLCTVNEMSQNLKKVLSKIPSGAKILFVIGPEGGFTTEEETTLIENNFLPISLGNTVLRTETASLFIMSVVRYLDMR